MALRRILKNGFTLIELLVVISIIALLAAIVLTSLNTARSKARDGRRVTDIKQIQLALSLYFNDNGTYPIDIYASNTLSPTYISSVPKDPSSNNSYAYVGLGNASTCTNYHLGAKLENNIQTAGQPLANDADFDSTNVALGTHCTIGSQSSYAGNSDIPGGSGSPYNGGFNGNEGATYTYNAVSIPQNSGTYGSVIPIYDVTP